MPEATSVKATSSTFTVIDLGISFETLIIEGFFAGSACAFAVGLPCGSLPSWAVQSTVKQNNASNSPEQADR
jgi:hypothetical protein